MVVDDILVDFFKEEGSNVEKDNSTKHVETLSNVFHTLSSEC